MACMLREAVLEKTSFSSVSCYQLEVAAGLGMGPVSAYPLGTGMPCGLDLCRP